MHNLNHEFCVMVLHVINQMHRRVPDEYTQELLIAFGSTSMSMSQKKSMYEPKENQPWSCKTCQRQETNQQAYENPW